MRVIVFLRLVIVLLACYALLIPRLGHAQSCDADLSSINTLYQSLLDDYLSTSEKNGIQANMVDYGELCVDHRLSDLRQQVANYPKQCLDTRNKKMAFYLNAYNILSMSKVADHWPIQKLKSLGSYVKPVWTHSAGMVCEEEVTLRFLEHDILRAFDEPRIHMALNCASMSCPDLRLEPYTAEALDQQLSDQTRGFLLQPGKGLSHLGEGKVRVSAIFDWFESDFDISGGVDAFINEYLPEYEGQLKVESYFRYDWDVNDILSGSEQRKAKKPKKRHQF